MFTYNNLFLYAGLVVLSLILFSWLLVSLSRVLLPWTELVQDNKLSEPEWFRKERSLLQERSSKERSSKERKAWRRSDYEALGLPFPGDFA